MSASTKSLVAKIKRLTLSAGSILAAGAVILIAAQARAAAPAGAQLDQNAVAPLVALDNAVEAVAARVTPAVVNVAVTSKGSEEEQQQQGQGFGGFDPNDLPPQFRQFFFGRPQQPQIQHGVGSGVIVTPDGYIVTNNHVIDGATKIKVTLNDRRVFDAKLVGVDKLNDLAVIKIETTGLTSIAWGDSTKVKPGQTVLAFGNPFGNFPFTVTRGIVSGINRPNPYNDDLRKPGDFIQTDAAINPGNSGGPLVNAYGELIGIDTFIISNSGSFAGAGFAIPSQIVKATTDALIKDGAVHHGYLGISMNDVTPENASFFNLPDASGAIVSQVMPDSPASRAGLERGDVLRELDGKKIVNGSALQVTLSQTAPGSAISLGILRNGKPLTLKLTVGEFHASKTDEKAGAGSEDKTGKFGFSVDDLTDDVRQQIKAPDTVKGAVVTNVRPGSPADDAGLTPGNVVIEVNRKPVADAQSFADAMHAAPAGKDVLLLVWANGGASYRVLHAPGADDNEK